MMINRMSILLVLALTTVAVFGQTFQYSRGWTNGKRASLEEIPDLKFNSPVKLDTVLTGCEMQKLRLLLQGNFNEQLYLLPCDGNGNPKRNYPENMPNQFRRSTNY